VRTAAAIALVVVAIGVAVAVARARRGGDEGARCGPGFVADGARCRVPAGPACPAPLTPAPAGCDAPDVRVLVPAATFAVGPSDWEAEHAVAPRTVRVAAFRLDAFEVTEARWKATMGAAAAPATAPATGEPARAASGMTLDEAATYCARRGGRLPTEDEWLAAASGAIEPPHRYPWGDTGAVCRRAAWGLASGPCARGADGPDTVGAHPDGDSPLGLHDLAGNVAEWTASPPGTSGTAGGVAKGGWWGTALASELRVWARLELPPGARDPRVGLRCAYVP
jgi:formylglycine-generating enzyme required for sulfatase activity